MKAINQTFCEPNVICIDGYAASGKGTIASGLADTLGLQCFSTGELYRYLTFKALEDNLDLSYDVSSYDSDTGTPIFTPETISRIISFANNLFRKFDYDVLNKISKNLYSPEVNKLVAYIASIPEIRTLLIPVQRAYPAVLSGKTVIFDGRDVGTIIFPKARFKIFVDCKLEVRAQRRTEQLIQNGVLCTFENVKSEIEARDKSDISRNIAPLVIPENSLTIDTTNITKDETLNLVIKYILG